MDRSQHNYPLEDMDRETLFHPNTSISDHLKNRRESKIEFLHMFQTDGLHSTGRWPIQAFFLA